MYHSQIQATAFLCPVKLGVLSSVQAMFEMFTGNVGNIDPVWDPWAILVVHFGRIGSSRE